jgi:hypothetical protein
MEVIINIVTIKNKIIAGVIHINNRLAALTKHAVRIMSEEYK